MCIENIFIKKNVYKWSKPMFATTNLNQKDSQWIRNTLILR